MYLAREQKDSLPVYILRESFQKKGVYYSRDIAFLGEKPEEFIRYSNDVAFEIDEELLDTLKENGISVDDDVLEDLFFPFLDPYVQFKLEPFRHRHRYRHWAPMSGEEKKQLVEKTHVFDRRRLIFLRLGNCPADILDKSPTLFRQLLNKSRDEIEQLVHRQESELTPRDYRNYLFSIFDLQRFFTSRLSRYMPYSLDPEKVDQFFVDQYCQLDKDESFWRGYTRTDRAPEYLLRYLIMYFDLAAEGDVFWRGGRAGGRRYRKAFHGVTSHNKMSMNKAAEVFGVSREKLASMSRKQITSLYRKKAHALHPDKGGEHDSFVELTAAYDELLRAQQ